MNIFKDFVQINKTYYIDSKHLKCCYILSYGHGLLYGIRLIGFEDIETGESYDATQWADGTIFRISKSI